MIDKVIDIPIFNYFDTYYKKYKEVSLYVFFGTITFFLNMFLYCFFYNLIHIDILITNIICWIVCVSFQFFTNRTWVFNNNTNGTLEIKKQFFFFLSSRIFTLFVEEVIIFLFVSILEKNEIIIKLIAQFTIIILNYILSKCIVFKC